MKSRNVVIPVYKPKPSDTEIISLNQCLKIFNNENITFCTYHDFDCREYDSVAERNGVEINYVFFDADFFLSQSSYNQLLLSKSFYNGFASSDYILIYQLDSFVFRNELDYWIENEYDYIGAPWFKYKGNQAVFDGVGNGGFSLRKVRSLLRILELNRDKIVKGLPRLLKEYRGEYPSPIFITKIPLIISRTFGYRNKIRYYLEHNTKKEDIFWGMVAPAVDPTFRIPDPETALQFAFEREPEMCYRLNNYQLPFGVHAWEKHNKEFWLPIIDSGNSLS
jgi:hypothetical protein